MQNPRQVILTADKSVCYERVINTILANLPEDYDFFDDVFELKSLCSELDSKLRNIS